MEYDQKKSNNRQSDAVVALFLLVGAIIAIYHIAPKEIKESISFNIEQKESISLSSEKVQEVLNKHLQETSTRIDTQQFSQKWQNNKYIPKVGDRLRMAPQRDNFATHGVDMAADKNSASLQQDASRGSLEIASSSPHSEVMGEIANQQRMEIYKEQADEEYKKEFIENARQNGYHIELTDDGRVKKVFKIMPNGKLVPEPLDE